MVKKSLKISPQTSQNKNFHSFKRKSLNLQIQDKGETKQTQSSHQKQQKLYLETKTKNKRKSKPCFLIEKQLKKISTKTSKQSFQKLQKKNQSSKLLPKEKLQEKASLYIREINNSQLKQFGSFTHNEKRTQKSMTYKNTYKSKPIYKKNIKFKPSDYLQQKPTNNKTSQSIIQISSIDPSNSHRPENQSFYSSSRLSDNQHFNPSKNLNSNPHFNYDIKTKKIQLNHNNSKFKNCSNTSFNEKNTGFNQSQKGKSQKFNSIQRQQLPPSRKLASPEQSKQSFIVVSSKSINKNHQKNKIDLQNPFSSDLQLSSSFSSRSLTSYSQKQQIQEEKISKSPSSLSKDEYTVQKIVSSRTKNGKTQYLIKWVGYPSQQNTYEPLKNLSNILNMVVQFENKERIKNQKLLQQKQKLLLAKNKDLISTERLLAEKSKKIQEMNKKLQEMSSKFKKLQKQKYQLEKHKIQNQKERPAFIFQKKASNSNKTTKNYNQQLKYSSSKTSTHNLKSQLKIDSNVLQTSIQPEKSLNQDNLEKREFTSRNSYKHQKHVKTQRIYGQQSFNEGDRYLDASNCQDIDFFESNPIYYDIKQSMALRQSSVVEHIEKYEEKINSYEGKMQMVIEEVSDHSLINYHESQEQILKYMQNNPNIIPQGLNEFQFFYGNAKKEDNQKIQASSDL